MNRKINVCVLTKFAFKDNSTELMSDGFLGRQKWGLFGIPWNSINQLMLVGFHADKNAQLHFTHNLDPETQVSIIGPYQKTSRRSTTKTLKEMLDRIIAIVHSYKILKHSHLIFSEFREFTFFEVVLIKLFAPRAKVVIFLIGDYPAANYERYHNSFFSGVLKMMIYATQLISDDYWFISKHLRDAYKLSTTRNFFITRLSNVEESEIATTPHQAPHNALKLIFVARLEEEKRPFVILKVIQNIKAMDIPVHLDIVGDGSLRAALEKQVVMLGIQENVVFHGRIADRARIFSLFRAADIFIFASIKGEGTPLVFIEASSQGLPSVACRYPGVEEIVREGKNGMLVNAIEEEQAAREITEHVSFLYRNPHVYESLSRQGIEIARELTLEVVDGVEKRSRMERLFGQL